VARQPNILFIFSDQQRWDTLGCYGQPLPITPNLDRLAREGVQFEHAFTPQPVCGPARACIQTGKYASETGCTVNDIGLPPQERTLAHWLSEAGYEVGYLGKWHLAADPVSVDPEIRRGGTTGPVSLKRRGGYTDFWLASDVLEYTSHSYDGHMFDGDGNRREFPPDRYRVDAQTDWLLEYLQTRTGERPFFLFVSYLEPHHQNDHNHFEGPRGSKERFRDFVAPGDLEGLEGDWQEEYPDYLGCCHSLDENVGRIWSELERLGLWEDTLLPLLLHGPGFQGGQVVTDLVSLIDLPPTVLRAGGVDVPESMRGRPVQQLVDGEASGWPEEVFSQISESHCGRAVRTKRWKYSARAPSELALPDHLGSPVYVEDFLYDLEADPHERTNLVRDPSYAGERTRLAEILKRRMQEAGEPVPEIRPPGSSENDR
jgi:uncharacterized sulfatase